MDAQFMGKESELEDRVAERAIWLSTPKDKRQETIYTLARQMRVAFPSDPFVYNRTISHLSSGIQTPQDYRAILRTKKKRG